jgi:ribosomal protein S12 methylthiotransferase accessory factor
MACGAEWLVRSGSEVVSVASPGASPDALEDVLDLLDGAHDWEAESRERGICPGSAARLLAELSRLSLIVDGAPASGSTPRRQVGPSHPFRRSGTPRAGRSTATITLLVAGLGPLGVAVLGELLSAPGVTVRVLDLAPVQLSDAGAFFERDDVGALRVDVVWGKLGRSARRRTSRIGGLGAGFALEAALAGADAVICCADQPTHLTALLTRACRDRNLPLVPVALEPETSVVGPALARPGPDLTEACPSCAAFHRARDAFAAALPAYLGRRFPRPARWGVIPGPGVLDALARLAVLAAFKAMDIRRGRRQADSALVLVDTRTGTARTSPLAKHHRCPDCFPAPSRTATQLRRAAERAWARHFRASEAAPRAGLASLAHRLEPLVAGEHALIRTSRPGVQDRLALRRFFAERGVRPEANALGCAHRVVATRIAIRGTAATRVGSEGLDFEDARAAEALAVMESLERLFALEHHDPGQVVHLRYVDAAGDALDPRGLPLYAEAQYSEPGFPFRRFTPYERIAWVWGMSLAQGRPILVPRDVVWWVRGPGVLFSPTSSGAAIHSGLPHAILNAVYEMIERDAFVIAWLARLSLPRLALPPDAPDPAGARRALAELDFECRYVDLTTDLGIPVVLALVRDRRNPDFLLPTMVAALRPERLLGKLHRELAQFVYPYVVDQRCFHTAITESGDPARVALLPDHLGFYQDRTRHPLTAFLTASSRTRRLAELPWGADDLDVFGELEAVSRRLAAAGHEVLVVDGSPPPLERLGIHAVRVLIPGLQPLHAGHGRAVLGGERLYRLPRQLGLADGDLTRADLNPWPHPFW